LRVIANDSSIEEDEKEEACDQRRRRLEADPEAWFEYYFPSFAYAQPAGFHKAATRRVLEHAEWYEVRLWSRELAKSTRTMMEVLYLTLAGTAPNSIFDAGESPAARYKKRYVLLIGNSLDNATRLLMPYRANLQSNRRLIQDYGPQVNTGHWQAAEFTTLNGVSFRALGAGQSPRGTRNEAARPDVILFDDVDTDADCLNPEIIAQKWRWIEEAAIGTRSVSEQTTIIFCGNRIATDCCIARAMKLADHVDVVNIRDGRGQSVWPEKNSEAAIDRVLSQKSYAAQQKEYFNNPLTEGSVFKEMAYKPVRPLEEYNILVCYTDPSYKDTNDYKATVLAGKWRNEYHIIKCYVDLTTTARMIDWHYRIMDIVDGKNCYYFMEEVFMQDVIRKEVNDAGMRAGRVIPISGDTRKKPDKYMRIESLLEPLHRNGQLYLNEHERHNPHMQRLAEQFLTFAPGSRAHDDGPDAVEGAIWKINEKLRSGLSGGIVRLERPENRKKY
jgi:predicted phage terminase large subunit-like protein